MGPRPKPGQPFSGREGVLDAADWRRTGPDNSWTIGRVMLMRWSSLACPDIPGPDPWQPTGNLTLPTAEWASKCIGFSLTETRLHWGRDCHWSCCLSYDCTGAHWSRAFPHRRPWELSPGAAGKGWPRPVGKDEWSTGCLDKIAKQAYVERAEEITAKIWKLKGRGSIFHTRCSRAAIRDGAWPCDWQLQIESPAPGCRKATGYTQDGRDNCTQFTGKRLETWPNRHHQGGYKTKKSSGNLGCITISIVSR